MFLIEKEHDQPRWLEALKRASTRRQGMSMEIGEGDAPVDAGVVSHANPLHSDAPNSPHGSPRSAAHSTTSDGDEDEDATVSTIRTMSSASFRMSNAVASDKEGYLLKKSPALMKGWQKRYFVTNSATGDIDYYKNVRCVAFISLL